jgi:hypothetical protein
LRELTSLFVPSAIEDDGYFRMKGFRLMAAQSKQTPSKEKSSANDIELAMRKANRCSGTRMMHKILFIVKKSVEEYFREDGDSRFLGNFEPIYRASQRWSWAVTAPL